MLLIYTHRISNRLRYITQQCIENILKLLKDTEFAKNIAETGYDKIQKTYSWKKLAEEFEKACLASMLPGIHSSMPNLSYQVFL